MIMLMLDASAASDAMIAEIQLAVLASNLIGCILTPVL
jgi:hypothetical protein